MIKLYIAVIISTFLLGYEIHLIQEQMFEEQRPLSDFEHEVIMLEDYMTI